MAAGGAIGPPPWARLDVPPPFPPNRVKARRSSAAASTAGWRFYHSERRENRPFRDSFF